MHIARSLRLHVVRTHPPFAHAVATIPSHSGAQFRDPLTAQNDDFEGPRSPKRSKLAPLHASDRV